MCRTEKRSNSTADRSTREAEKAAPRLRRRAGFGEGDDIALVSEYDEGWEREVVVEQQFSRSAVHDRPFMYVISPCRGTGYSWSLVEHAWFEAELNGTHEDDDLAVVY